jgi:hypothetical protein
VLTTLAPNGTSGNLASGVDAMATTYFDIKDVEDR